MTHNDLLNGYFEWLCKVISADTFSEVVSYRKLLMQLHNTPFRYSIPKDADRAGEGVNLRWRFVCKHELTIDGSRFAVLDELDGPCSVLEMMVAVAMHCEEHIMDDPSVGNRTGQWFWGMVNTLGLGAMTDERFDKQFVDDAITRFLDRNYDPDGKGGLFRIKNCDRDLRKVPIFYQLCWYLNTIS